MPHSTLDDSPERKALRCVYMRSGTSKGLYIHASELPADPKKWIEILPAVMGSPDPYRRQLDGLGGGASTLSKVAVVKRSERKGVDIDYTFVQVPLDKKGIDMTGNCGNISTGVGPFAVEEGLVNAPRTGQAAVVIYNTNTSRTMLSTFQVVDGHPVETGELEVDGVSSKGHPIRLDFLDPAGSMTGLLLPTGRATDYLQLEDPSGLPSGIKHPIRASMVDVTNPFVFVHADDLGLAPDSSIFDTDFIATMAPIAQQIRRAAAVAMGLATNTKEAGKTLGTPKVCIVAPPAPYTTLSNRNFVSEDMDIRAQAYSMGRPHQALQITGAVCLSAACYIPGTIPFEIIQKSSKATVEMEPSKLVAEKDEATQSKIIRVGHPSGIICSQCDSLVEVGPENRPSVHIKRASLFRTARRLMKGTAYYYTAAKDLGI